MSEIVGVINRIVKDMNTLKEISDNLSAYMKKQLTIKDEVLRSANEIKTKTASIEFATREHSMAIEDVTKSITYINEMIQKSTLESENLTRMGSDIAQANIKLIEISRFFKLGEEEQKEH